MNIVDVLLGKPESKEFNLGKDGKIVLKTLTQQELEDVMEKLPRLDLSMMELQKIPILARAIVSINGVDIHAFGEVQEAIKKDEKVRVSSVIEDVLRRQMDTTMINLLYGYYGELLEETTKKRESLKNC